MSDVPYWRLAALYFSYFAVVGVISPYWGLYLNALGFAPTQIGVVVAMPMITRIFAPNIWGWLADRSGQYLGVIRFGAVGAALGFIGIFFVDQFWGVVLFAALFTFFWNAILPQCEVVTLDALQERSYQYSKIRLWGSLGFIAAVVGLGGLYDAYSVKLLPWSLWLLLLAIAAATFSLPNYSGEKKARETPSILPYLKAKPLICFLLAAFLLHLSHGAYYGFFSLFLQTHEYRSAVIGVLWAVGVIIEIVVFLRVPYLLRRFRLWHCYLASLLAAVLRWALIGYFPDNMPLLVLAQSLHALTFALAHAVSIEMMRCKFAPQLRGSAQALYSAFCFGGGGALGAYVCGFLWSMQPAYCFYFAALAALLGVGVALVGATLDGDGVLAAEQNAH